MSLNSIHTRAGTMLALQVFHRTGEELAAVQRRLGTGLRVADARDDAGAFAVAERVRSDIAATASVNQQLGGIKGLLDVSRAGLENVMATLNEMKASLVRLADGNNTEGQRAQHLTQIKGQVLSILNALRGASYNGMSVLNTSPNIIIVKGAVPGIDTIRSGDGAVYGLSLIPVNQVIMLPFSEMRSATFWSAFTQGLMNATGRLEDALNAAAEALNRIGSYARYVDRQIAFNRAIMDARDAGLGALVDADLAKEAALLLAISVRRQLGAETLAIANQAPQILLSPFGGPVLGEAIR